MKERPILFNSEMVRAVLDGRKTQTRRIVSPQPDSFHDNEPYWNVGGYRAWAYRGITDVLRMGTNNPLKCKYGLPGDRLWVRETHSIRIKPEESTDGIGRAWYYATSEDQGITKWKPSIHMPRWASRITLEITGVRVERLQDISEADAQAECAQNINGEWAEGYAVLWESINGPGSWDANPWVWVIEFKKIA